MTDAVLVLADGTVFKGKSIGYLGYSVGEVVFNTSMTGYQEILTDPSYAKQIVTLTYPHIGNTGTNLQDEESDCIYVKGLVVRDLSQLASNFRSESDLSTYLNKHKIIAIADIDTRQLTKKIRQFGVQAGCLVGGDNIDIAEAISLAKEFGSMQGKDLANEVSCQQSYSFKQGAWSLAHGFETPSELRYKVVVYDFGVKKSILRLLVSRACDLIVVPANSSANEVLALNPDGIFLSNGPGDPEPCQYAIDAIQQFLKLDIPLFGICLGHQLLALALGGKTKKMKFGHHGANHPVINLQTRKVAITSQNHGFEVDIESLPNNVKITHLSLFDNSLQGIELEDKPVFSFQGHPEAGPGPQDLAILFDQFVENIQQNKINKK